jgi:hypothetical protein
MILRSFFELLLPVRVVESINSHKILDCSFFCSGSTVIVNVTLEREDEISGPILAPFFPQVINFSDSCVSERRDDMPI